MKIIRDISQQTSPHSPSRLFKDQFSKQASESFYLMNGSTRHSTARMSETESQIYSHKLIRDVMQESKARTIMHDINRVDEESALYRIPLKQEVGEYHFDSIPPTNQMFLSACSNTIKKIDKGLISDRHDDRDKHLQIKESKKRPTSAIMKMNTHNKKVSVSGLVTYNFNSVLAKKSLGLNLVNHEEHMIKTMASLNNKLHCSKERNNRILAKSSCQRYNRKQRDERTIMKEFQTGVDAYLKNIIAERQQNQIIFNQRAKKINCVKQYMQKERVDYDLAYDAVTIIENSKQKISKPPILQEKMIENDEKKLMNRRIPIQRKAVIVNNFYFIE